MNIKMIGIDHEKASLCQREIFAFTESQAMAAMGQATGEFPIQGAVMISTCNRTELWVSAHDDQDYPLETMLCQLKGIPLEAQGEYNDLFVMREGREALHHLFQTACGLKSQVFGEDQILTQVKKSIEVAREANTSDRILEKLFQMAITSAKRIKTEVRVNAADASIALRTVQLIEAQIPLAEASCMIIGNGEMGRLVATELVKRCKDCHITFRRHGCGEGQIPTGCHPTLYEERYEKLNHRDVVVSATVSPHYTIKVKDLMENPLPEGKSLFFIDLAVPRDIEPEVATMDGIQLYDMDSMEMNRDESSKGQVEKAEKIIQEYLEEFQQWYRTKDFLMTIQNIARTTTQRISYNMKKEMDELNLDEQAKRLLELKLMNISEKAVSGLLFHVKDSIEMEHWDSCFSNLEKTVR